jgi:hypothetical protein
MLAARFVRRLLQGFFLLLAMVCAACKPKEGIVDVRVWEASGDVVVENGFAYDKAVIDITKEMRSFVVPQGALLRQDGPTDQIELYMEKHLDFHGHPPKSMSVRWARDYMGCAVKQDDGELTLATFGEWDSKEGGATMQLAIKIPHWFAAKTRSDLSGAQSEAQGPVTAVDRGYWYGPSSPGAGWQRLESEPDLDLTVRTGK